MSKLVGIEGAESFPDKLRAAKGNAARVGMALSGGGIRSATLSLGFFQGLARHGMGNPSRDRDSSCRMS